MGKIKKRDGRIVKFNLSKIVKAIEKAGQATGEFNLKVAENLAKTTILEAKKTFKENLLEVEKVQDIVEDVLLASPYRATAKAYIIYREKRTQMRNLNEKLNSDLMEGYLNLMDWRVRENSNMGFSLQGLNNYISSEVTSEYWLNKIYSPKIRAAHKEGDIHLHDLNLLSVYCVGWDLEDILKEGFKGVSGNVESSPPKHFRTALGQLVNFFYTLQGEAAGAQAVSSFDTLLAPFIRHDNLTYKEIKQALQEFIFNINIPTRVGFQTPFTNISLDLKVPKAYQNSKIIIAGQEQDATYSEYQAEMDLLNQAFAEVMMEGDNKGRVFTFPIPTYNITKDFDWDNPAYEAIWKMTGRYGIPYFANFVNSDMEPDDVRSMCCRLRIDNRELRKRGGGLFGANPLTGSIGVVTINLPRLGYLAKDENSFFEKLNKLMLLAKESLVIKRKELERFTEDGLYPYTIFYLRNVKECTGKYWTNHFSTIGLVGMNEAVLNFLGEDISSEKGYGFSLKVLNFMKAKLADFQEETGSIFNLEATPAEGTSYRLAKLDKKRYENIVFGNSSQNTNDVFYTNSTHLPVDFSSDLFEVLEHQDALQSSYTGGTVLHAFIGEEIEDIEIVKNIIKKVTANYSLPYFSLTPTFSVCGSHGYLAGEQFNCPTCNEETEVYSRVVGYLRPIKCWNDGKQSEYKMRKIYSTPTNDDVCENIEDVKLDKVANL